MAQQLRILVFPPEDPSSTPNTLVGQLTIACNSNTKGNSLLTCTYTCPIPTYLQKVNIHKTTTTMDYEC